MRAGRVDSTYEPENEKKNGLSRSGQLLLLLLLLLFILLLVRGRR